MLFRSHAAQENDPDTWEMAGLTEYLEHICLAPGGVKKAFDSLTRITRDDFAEALKAESEALYESRERMLTQDGFDMREFERVALLNSVDRRWMNHIDAMDQLRDGIGLRAYGHRDPIVEYKLEGYEMFEEMVRMIQEDTLRVLNFATLVRPPERKEVAKPVAATHGESEAQVKKPARAQAKVGRNDPCPCGSGKKYKECCGRNG